MSPLRSWHWDVIIHQFKAHCLAAQVSSEIHGMENDNVEPQTRTRYVPERYEFIENIWSSQPESTRYDYLHKAARSWSPRLFQHRPMLWTCQECKHLHGKCTDRCCRTTNIEKDEPRIGIWVELKIWARTAVLQIFGQFTTLIQSWEILWVHLSCPIYMVIYMYGETMWNLSTVHLLELRCLSLTQGCHVIVSTA